MERSRQRILWSSFVRPGGENHSIIDHDGRPCPLREFPPSNAFLNHSTREVCQRREPFEGLSTAASLRLIVSCNSARQRNERKKKHRSLWFMK